MQTRKFLSYVFMIMILLLSACAQAAPTQEAMMEKSPDEMDGMMAKDATPTPDAMMAEKKDMMEHEATHTPDSMMEKEDMQPESTATAAKSETMDDMSEQPMMNTPAWFNVQLTDVNSGQDFTINDYHGKVILVETMAQWCSTCLKQQKQVADLHKLLGEQTDFVSLALDIDANEDTASLKAYTAKNQFTWIYAVTPAEVAREIGNLYGSQFLNPPSAPMFIIDRNGEVHPLPFGVKSADDLFKALEPFLKDGM